MERKTLTVACVVTCTAALAIVGIWSILFIVRESAVRELRAAQTAIWVEQTGEITLPEGHLEPTKWSTLVRNRVREWSEAVHASALDPDLRSVSFGDALEHKWSGGDGAAFLESTAEYGSLIDTHVMMAKERIPRARLQGDWDALFEIETVYTLGILRMRAHLALRKAGAIQLDFERLLKFTASVINVGGFHQIAMAADLTTRLILAVHRYVPLSEIDHIIERQSLGWELERRTCSDIILAHALYYMHSSTLAISEGDMHGVEYETARLRYFLEKARETPSAPRITDKWLQRLSCCSDASMAKVGGGYREVAAANMMIDVDNALEKLIEMGSVIAAVKAGARVQKTEPIGEVGLQKELVEYSALGLEYMISSHLSNRDGNKQLKCYVVLAGNRGAARTAQKHYRTQYEWVVLISEKQE